MIRVALVFVLMSAAMGLFWLDQHWPAPKGTVH